ncbi:MAG: helix-turn-helix domain-containing protein, partial [Pseudomonadota bacterium]
AVEQELIEATIKANGGSIPKAARVLKVSPSTIYRKREAWTREAG